MPAYLLYDESEASPQTTDTGNWDYIKGLSLTLPPETPDGTFAVVTLNVPNAYAKGNDYPGCNFAIETSEPGKKRVMSPIGCFTSFNKVADPAGTISAGRVPVTLVCQVLLHRDHRIRVHALWQSVRGATAVIDSPCSLSAVTGKP